MKNVPDRSANKVEDGTAVLEVKKPLENVKKGIELHFKEVFRVNLNLEKVTVNDNKIIEDNGNTKILDSVSSKNTVQNLEENVIEIRGFLGFEKELDNLFDLSKGKLFLKN